MSAIFVSVLEEPAPLDLQQIFCDRWVRPSCIKAEEFQRGCGAPRDHHQLGIRTLLRLGKWERFSYLVVHPHES